MSKAKLKEVANEPEGDYPKAGDNKASAEFIVQCTAEMADVDSQRKKLNKKASEIRQSLKDRGVDNDAFKDVYAYFKKRRGEREGYDEDHKLCFDALNKADTGKLFAFQDDKE